MKQPARLITPRGKMIELPPDIYAQVQRLLAERKSPRSHAQMTKAIHSTFGKYKHKRSLTNALLRERAEEYAREQAKFISRNG